MSEFYLVECWIFLYSCKYWVCSGMQLRNLETVRFFLVLLLRFVKWDQSSFLCFFFFPPGQSPWGLWSVVIAKGSQCPERVPYRFGQRNRAKQAGWYQRKGCWWKCAVAAGIPWVLLELCRNKGGQGAAGGARTIFNLELFIPHYWGKTCLSTLELWIFAVWLQGTGTRPGSLGAMGTVFSKPLNGSFSSLR